MTDKPEPRGKDCCPILRMAAESERLAGHGIITDDHDHAARTQILAIHIAMTRERYGCNGPEGRFGCPYQVMFRSETFGLDPDVPLLRRRDDNPDTGQML